MDTVTCVLTCGFLTNYKDLVSAENGTLCWACKSHPINIQDCLNMPFNRLNLKRKKVELEKENFMKSKIYFDKFKIDPEFFIENGLKNIKNEIDVRREELKLKIDDYYRELFNDIEKECIAKRSSFDSAVKILDEFESYMKSQKYDQVIEYENQINQLETYSKEINEKISLICRTVDYLQGETLILSRKVNDYKMIDVFGALTLKNNPDRTRNEATFRFTVNQFRNILNRSHDIKVSRPCFIKNVTWRLIVESKINKNNNETFLGVYLRCNEESNSDNWSIFAHAQIKLINLKNLEANYIKKCKHVFYPKGNTWGFDDFIELKKLIDPINGFYDHFSDFFSLEAHVNVDTVCGII